MVTRYIDIPLTEEEEEDIEHIVNQPAFEEDIEDGFGELVSIGGHSKLPALAVLTGTQAVKPFKASDW
jgi:hypothetical protein